VQQLLHNLSPEEIFSLWLTAVILRLKEITHERAAQGRKHSIRKNLDFQGRGNFKDLLT
jgi:hypothetical protein